MQQEDDLRGLAKVMEFMRAISIVVLLPGIRGCGYQYRSGRQDTPEFPEDGGAFQQPAGDKSVRRHIPCAVMFGHEGCEKPEDDLAENIYRFPFGACIVLHELVDARPAVQSDS